MTRHTWIATLLGAVVGAGVMLAGLAQAGRLAPAPRPEVLVTLAQTVDAEHRRVDVLLKQRDYAGAIAALEQMRTIAWPEPAVAGDAAAVLRHDVYGRLVRLRLDHPDVDPKTPDALAELVGEGLGADYKAIATNAFTARLVGLRGEIAEKQGRDGDALLAYEEALDMNRALLQQALAGAAP
ncbi:hypothetical protein OV203_15170 [Nannocystis sp. ILAH1]|uniref:hypothetical protein n=1 Tax=unclassified Nannocystis TaxID=2627009 RepID=UPI0022704711|nr:MULTISPECIES: hypothetical protein [unclassified Nannocystis]MCY0988471.1 hypothetical protein [Nannocystis sp. ILAH1]MCY1067567.1 hypothetical protein [Nannocystis sp. RBIL2]